MNRYAERLLQHVESLPCLPPVLIEAMELTREPDASATALAGVIRQDPALTAEVLRLANSSFYGFRRGIGTVTVAVTLLGFTAVRHLLLSAEVLNLLDVVESADFSPVKFWEHAVATGLLARGIAQRAERPQREELFVAGLLHDAGKLLEYRVFRKEFVSALLLAANEGVPMYAAEERILGINHETVGRALADRWMLPPTVQEAIGAHHHVAAAREKGWEVAAVHVANSLAKQMTAGEEASRAPVSISEEVWTMLGLSPEIAGVLLEESAGQFAEAVTLVTGWWRRVPRGEDAEEDVVLPGASHSHRLASETTPPFLPGSQSSH